MYKLMQGDCLDVLPTIATESINAIITDPPYGISYQSAWRIDASERKPKIKNDDKPFIWWLYQAYRVLAPDGALLCFCEWRHQETFKMAIECAGFTIKSQVIWDRCWHGLGDLNASFAPQHDVIWFAIKDEFEFKNGRPKTIKRFQRISAEALVHPTEKPTSLLVDLIEDVTGEGQTVLDPFMGSGSTGISAIQLDRDFIGIELDVNYFAIAKKRIEDAARAAAKLPKQLTGSVSDYSDAPLFAQT